MTIIYRIANAVMFLAFAFSVIVQFNDPDPIAWIAVYGAAAIVCGLAMWKRARPLTAAVVGIIALGWAASIAPRVVGTVPFASMFEEFEMKDAGVEESREMYGLLIIALWMGVVTAVRLRSANRAQLPEHHRGVS
jgi:hypothetical protein